MEERLCRSRSLGPVSPLLPRHRRRLQYISTPVVTPSSFSTIRRLLPISTGSRSSSCLASNSLRRPRPCAAGIRKKIPPPRRYQQNVSESRNIFADIMTLDPIRVLVKKIHPEARVPRFMHAGAHGDLAADLYAIEETTIEPHKMNVVRTGICLGLPAGYGALVHDRSGLAAKGVATFGGVIDPGYRGELKIIMTSVGEQTIEIKPGDRVCQLRFVR